MTSSNLSRREQLIVAAALSNLEVRAEEHGDERLPEVGVASDLRSLRRVRRRWPVPAGRITTTSPDEGGPL